MKLQLWWSFLISLSTSTACCLGFYFWITSPNSSSQPRPVIPGSYLPQDCGDDLQRFCAELKSEDEKDACLHDHYDSVSKNCLGYLDYVRNRMDANCGLDREKYCREIPFGGGRIARCLRTHYGTLSITCAKIVGPP